MSDIARLFGARAEAYASFRPAYPSALFDWLAAHSPGRQVALDIACGNGQASHPLLRHFDRVLASDASVEQLARSQPAAGLHLLVAEARRQPLADARVDLIVVAQALHWFADAAFFAEVARLLRPGGLFCAWCYSLMTIDERLDPLIERFYRTTLAGCWPAGRSSVDAGYADIQAPFRRVPVPTFALSVQWRLPQLLGYLRTWSAVQRWQQRHGRDPVAELTPALRDAWGDDGALRSIDWPLHFLAGTPMPDATLTRRTEAR